MADQVTIQVGKKNYAIQPDHLPPVGTQIAVHKHLYDGGTTPLLEVVGYEWRLEEPPEVDGLPVFAITIQTRIVPE